MNITQHLFERFKSCVIVATYDQGQKRKLFSNSGLNYYLGPQFDLGITF